MDSFVFGDPPEPAEGRILVALERVHSKRELLASIASGLRFPDWFGSNWDALDESLRDLSWLSEAEVILHHRDLPDLPIDELRTYLSILERTATTWRQRESRAVEVSFAPEIRRILETVVEVPD